MPTRKRTTRPPKQRSGSLAPTPDNKTERSNRMLGPVDFSGVEDYKPLQNGEYPAQTKSWEPKLTKAGDSTNIEAKFVISYEDPETGDILQRTLLHRWNTKKTALWRVKRDLIAMGADPEDLKGDSVNLEGILDDMFGAPLPVVVTLGTTTFTPEGGEPQQRNEIVKIRLAD